MSFSPRRFFRNAAIIGSTLALGAVFVVNGVIPNIWPKNFAAVEPGRIYRSGVLTTTALEKVVVENDIALVIDLGAHHPGSAGERRESRTVELLGARRLEFPLFGDGTGDPNRYVQALKSLHEADGPVLVHCAAGAQRTGVAIALYRMIDSGWSLDQALAEAGRFGYDPADNPKLRPYLERWHDAIADSLVSGKPIPYDGPTAGDKQ